MGSKRSRIALCVCAVLFVAALVLALVLDGGPVLPGTRGTVVLSEVMASNRTCVAPNGKYLDYIEVRNLSDRAADISGFMLSDSADSIGYTFPYGTVLPAGGYAVCWCDPDDTTGRYADFAISRDGKDQIYLYNTANVVIDSIKVPFSQPNEPLIRLADGSWQTGKYGTPGFSNDEAGLAAWEASISGESGSVLITEVLTGSRILWMDSSGRSCDWVELYNPGLEPVNLSGGYLTDDPGDLSKHQLPELVIAPRSYVLIPCGTADGAGFKLSRTGCVITLSGVQGQRLSQLEVPALDRDVSWAMGEDGSYSLCQRPTPGFSNDDSGYAAWLESLGGDGGTPVITEVMSRNRGYPIDGGFYDWLELYNPTGSAIELEGFWLSNDPDEPGLWQLPRLTLPAGGYALIPCAGVTATDGQATLSLGKEGCTITLCGRYGQRLATLEVPALEQDRSWAKTDDGYGATHLATPGFANTEEGRHSWLQTQKPAGALAISEIMPSNNAYYRQSDGKYYDWIELYNASSQTIQLSDYALSNDPEDPDRFPLPQGSLAPGEYITVICTGGADLSCNCIHADFSLSRAESWLYVTGKNGLSDCMHIYDVPYRGSVGRSGRDGSPVYFTTPTPGGKNGDGTAMLSQNPVFTTQPGIYEDVTAVEVALTGRDIRYTTDGSAPRWDSTPYTGPIRLEKTCVIRAASFAPGKLPSDTVTASYVINEGHTLPVISLAAEPAELFGGNGLYVNYTTEREIPCNISLFEPEGGFQTDCGLKMFGHMGLTLPKKSFKVNFRGCYGLDALSYPVYGEDGPTVYDSLIIRSGQDYPTTIFRDELFTSLCREAGGPVLAQRDKFCILYINGAYRGIYCMKEAFGETMYAENYGVDAHTVEVAQAPVFSDAEMFDLITYCRKTDLSIPENYEYFCSQMDVDSLIDWMIFEGYTANTDVQQNLRYFRCSQVEGKWQFAFYDLDWAWYFQNGFINMWSPEKSWQHMPLCIAPMKNPEFREKFFTRAAELRSGVLSDSHVLQRIDEYVALLSPEIEREKAMWGGSYAQWERNVNKMRAYLTERDHWDHLIDHMRRFVGLTDQEYQKYFGGSVR